MTIDLVSPAEIAELLGVQIDTVHQWRKRDRLPVPDYVFGGVPVWVKSRILDWALNTGRLAPEEDMAK